MASIAFGGAQITRPGAYSTVDTANMTPSSIGSFKALGFVGVATSATIDVAVATVRWYNSQTIALAEKELGDSALLANMKIAWLHGADLIAVSVVSKTATDVTPPTDQEWQTAINAFDMEFIDGLVVMSTDTAIHTKALGHATAQSSVLNRKERRAFLGHQGTATKEEVITLATALADERAIIASPAVKVLKSDGTQEVKTSIELASAYAGAWAGKGINSQDPITYDYVKFPGLAKLYTPTEIGELLEAGVAVSEVVKGKGVRIVQGITTSPSEDLTKRELSVSTLKDDMSRELRETLEDKHVGNAGVEGIEITIYNDAVSKIEEFKKRGWIRGYVEDSIKVIQLGTAFTVDWEGKPTLPINNFLITSHFTL